MNQSKENQKTLGDGQYVRTYNDSEEVSIRENSICSYSSESDGEQDSEIDSETAVGSIPDTSSEDESMSPTTGKESRSKLSIETNQELVQPPDQNVNPTQISNESTTNERIASLEKTLADLTRVLSQYIPQPGSSKQVDDYNNWNSLHEASNYSVGSSSSSSAIRLDSIKPFPSGIPANKMWEAWNKYIENFELAVSLSNANNPVQRTRLLFFSIGEEMQEIVRAAKLRPSLDDPNCYAVFVKNVYAYLKSMTDTSAEHEAFSSMKQEKAESAVAFHARLVGKVRLCGYSIDDQDRFVRAQLLKGLKNKELVKSARIYGYETNFIVQSATRDEAFEVEKEQLSTSDVFAVTKMQHRYSNTRENRKRKYDNETDHRQPKRNFSNERHGQGRRSRCPRCYHIAHRGERCPAIGKTCNTCGRRDHFAAACRRKRINNIRKQSASPNWSDKEEKVL